MLVGCTQVQPAGSTTSDASVPLAQPTPPPPSPPSVESPPPALVAVAETESTSQIAIPAGVLRAGSAPGTPHRRPSVEADLVEIVVPAFSIDRLPYPNDPAEPPLLVHSRAEAAAHCAARGMRLCHELEWERACKGDGIAAYATGDVLDLTRCTRDRMACASPTGVLDLGLSTPEWTASDAEPRLARLERTVVARGASSDDPVEAHRCAARRAVAPVGSALAFRCCAGPAPDLTYPDVGVRRVFRDLELDEARARAILAGVPELAQHASSFRPYGRADALRALARGRATETSVHWEIAPGPFAWSPSVGEEAWVLAGSAGESTVIAALYPMPDGTFRHAASFVLAGEVAPIALLRTSSSRAELLWSACWGCAGESGAIRFDEASRIVIVQQ